MTKNNSLRMQRELQDIFHLYRQGRIKSAKLTLMLKAITRRYPEFLRFDPTK